MWDPYAEFQSATLPNGLTVHAAHWPGRPWEAMGFLIHSGAKHDPVGFEGLSHFVEHLVSKNNNITKKDMNDFFEDCGGMVSLGTTGYPYTQYFFFVPTDKTVLARALSIFGHMLLSAKFEKFIEQERQVIIDEFNQYYPLKFKFDIDVRKCKALYTGCWLERFVRPIGTPESIKRIMQGELQSYYDAHYTPVNISIVGVGGMTLSEIVELLSESSFAIDKKGVKTPLPSPADDVTPPSENRYIFEVSKHIIEPIKVGAYWSVAKIPGNVNTAAIRIMCKMFNEILNEEVRERRAWTYSIDSSWHNFQYFFQEFSINCNALALGALDEIEEIIEICISSMGDQENLFEQVKRRVFASNFMIDPKGKSVCESAIDDLANDQRIISLTEYGNDIERVTMSEIRNLLQWLRPEWRWTLITRP